MKKILDAYEKIEFDMLIIEGEKYKFNNLTLLESFELESFEANRRNKLGI